MSPLTRIWVCYLLIASGVLGHPGILGAAYNQGRRSLGTSDASLRHEVNNHSEEIRMLFERLATQESLIEALREDIQKMEQLTKTTATNDAKTTQARLIDLERKEDHLSEQVTNYRQKIESLEATIQRVAINHKHLEGSLGTLLDAVADESNLSNEHSQSQTIYKVVSGDSLERIARRHKTTIKALKEKNGLSSDRIIVGQKLTIPTASS